MNVDKLLDDNLKDVKKILKDNKGAAAGAAVGYIVSENNKERNALFGGILGWFLTKKKKTEDDEYEDEE